MSERETAVIVGVGPGLGTALTRAFAAEGYTVVAMARDAERLQVLKEGPGGAHIHPLACDAGDPASVDAVFDHILAGFGPLRVAVYNAGSFLPGKVVDTDPAIFEKCWRIGCFGGFLVGRRAAQAMLPRGTGTILFTGATASLRGGAGFVNLAAPKFGLRAVAQSLARELSPQGIHVAHVLIDGQIRSPRHEALLLERGPNGLLEPEEIARAYVMLHRQHPSTWTQELDLRPWVEKF